MTIEIYVSRDSSGRPWPPDYSFEALATIGIIKRLWLAFNHLEACYAVFANLQDPSADLVIISERGLGVVELKHYYGPFSVKRDGTWKAGPKRIKAGAASQGFVNPHKQVQAYAEKIYGALVLSRGQGAYLPGSPADRGDFRFHTSVCFTHPDTTIKHIESFRKALRRRRQPKTEKWEEFKILKSDEIPEWTASLRFEANMGREYSFEPHCLSFEQIEKIATRLLGGTKWTEIVNLMPTGEPYAYLTRKEGGRRVQVIGLDREEVCLGRNADTCAVPIPERFTFVSRRHALIKRTIDGILVKDLGSTNGTFINGQSIPEGDSKLLKDGQKITLGGPEPDDKVPLLEFSQTVKSEIKSITTEFRSVDN